MLTNVDFAHREFVSHYRTTTLSHHVYSSRHATGFCYKTDNQVYDADHSGRSVRCVPYSAALTLGFWVCIPVGAWMYASFCVFILRGVGRGLPTRRSSAQGGLRAACKQDSETQDTGDLTPQCSGEDYDVFLYHMSLSWLPQLIRYCHQPDR
jgi:hypothetical protein